jgi:hypothetical protein
VAVNITSASTSAGVTTAEKVQEIPAPKRRKFPVTKSRGRNKTAFYRSVSHRPMRLDEGPLSESDDDMDDLWKEQEDLNDVEKEFMVRWGMHIMAEHFPHGRYVSDSMVRFVRKEKIWLRRSCVLLDWCRLIQELKEYGVVDSKVIKECYKILRSNDPVQAGLNDVEIIHANSGMATLAEVCPEKFTKEVCQKRGEK